MRPALWGDRTRGTVLRDQLGFVRDGWFVLACGAVRAADLQREHRYSFISGCRIESNDGIYIPIDNYRVTDEEDQP